MIKYFKVAIRKIIKLDTTNLQTFRLVFVPSFKDKLDLKHEFN